MKELSLDSKQNNIDIEEKILQLYGTGERDRTKFLKIMGQKCKERGELLDYIIKKRGLGISICNQFRKTITKVYMGGCRDILDFIPHAGINCSYDILLNVFNKFQYNDIKICTEEEFCEERKRYCWSLFLFKEDNKEYTIDELNKIFEKRFDCYDRCDSFPSEIRDWLENFYKYNDMEGLDEKTLRSYFIEQKALYDKELFKRELNQFHMFLKDFITSHKIKDFKLNDSHKYKPEDDDEEIDAQESDLFDSGDEFEE